MQWDNLKIPLLSALFLAASRTKVAKAQDESSTRKTEIYINTELVDEEAERQNASFNEWCRLHSGRKVNQEL